MSLWNKNLDLAVALQEKSGNHQSHENVCSQWISEPNFMTIHSIVVKTFHQETKDVMPIVLLQEMSEDH